MAPTQFEPAHAWVREVAPDGVPVGETTVIAGAGGSGKPLIGFAVVESWLRAGGSVVVVATNSGPEFVVETIDRLYGLDVTGDDQVAFVDFDPEMDPSVTAMESPADGPIRANLLADDVWRASIDRAVARVDGDGPGTLVVASALNLLLFSETYREEAIDTLLDAVERDDDLTRLFAVSTSAFEDEIERIEAAADTVLVSAMDDGRLRLRGESSASVDVSTEFVDVPFSADQIESIKAVSEETRQTLIPTLKDM
ncbi:hypothetical protein [Halococcoides cellulosivorans]|uniref:KaiC-like domain-containing protein n=1 Tax=Halococcoides cellulosivorans TaxID=1679096 RepID=A0A2R4WXP5_9EURY|nr:hypothetical protein [Halococcoides cellulosivorans]AWB26290.1 hypothetical protein HARCEL1_00430 [Halococcoides cellulosivorans]